MNKARWVQRLAFAGAAGLLGWALTPGVGAQAAAAPPQSFSTVAGASGVEYTFEKHPRPTPVGDLIHGSTPYATATMLGIGSTNAEAASVYLGGIQGIPGLICTAAATPSGSFCDNIPPEGTFPPPFPFDAYAQYPAEPSADATVSTKQPIGGGGAPLTAHPGRTHAEAKQTSTLADATASSTQFLAGVVTTGSSSSIIRQSINSAGAVVAHAETTVKDVNIAKFVKLGSVRSVIDVVYNGKNKPKVTSTTTFSNATANGIGITIDQKGAHAAGAFNNKVQDVLDKQLNYLLGTSGFTVKSIGGSSAFAKNTVNVQSGGLLMTYNNSVAGVPTIPAVGDIPMCSEILKPGGPLDPLLSQIPVNFCTPPAPPDPNGRYSGTATFGRAGVTVQAATFDLDLGGGSGVIPGGIPGTGPTTTTTAGTPGTPGTSGTPGTPGTEGTLGSNPPPNVAPPNSAVGYVENLGDVAERLKYLFPAFLLAVIGFLAGRVGRAPARLPRAVS
jgi:hypothetical protein